MTELELNKQVWEAANDWTELNWTGIDLVKAIRYDMLQTVFGYLELGEEKETCQSSEK